jgi:DNA-binding IclR family transcriptional regulator
MKSLGTALKVLAEFSGSKPSWGVGELADKCGLPKSQVSKILSSFREHGFLVKDQATRRYSVGLRAFMLGSRFVTHHDLSREALPIMRGLVDASGHSVRLSVVDGGEVIYLLAIEGPLLLHTGWRAGTVLPWHATSAGRILLAFASPEERDAILERTGLPAITPYTITDRSKLDRQLAAARQLGYATARGESTPGLGAISVPILGQGQAIIGALTLAFPEHVVAADEEPALVTMLHDSARMLSLRSGSPVYSFRVGRESPPATRRPAARRAGSRGTATGSG